MYKSLLCTCSTLFRVHFFAVVLHDLQCETSWLHVLWRKYRTCFCSFFFYCLPFSPWWPLAFLIFPSAAKKFSCCSSNKKTSLCILSLALAVYRSFSRWASLACRLLSLFLCLSLYCKFVDMTSNLSQEPITRGRVTPILGLRHGVFTDQFIFRHILGHFFSRK